MRRLPGLLLVLLFFLGKLQAQRPPQSPIDAHADTLRRENFPNLFELTDQLIGPAQGDREKVRAIFYWIAKNIRYDHPGRRTHYWDLIPAGDPLARHVYERGSGICSGYAQLLHTMLSYAGITDSIVEGYAKGDSYAPAADTSANHAWNAVQIDGRWHLLDATWASPATANEPIREMYFMAEPGRLAASHLPIDEKWTLLGTKMSRADFNQLPKVNDLFYEMGFGTAPPVVEQTPGRVRLALQLPEKIIIGFILWNKTTQELTDAPFTIEKGQQGSTVTVEVPREGDYSVEMTAMQDAPPYRKNFGIVVVDIKPVP